MRFPAKMILILPTLLIASCASSIGDFCDVVSPPVLAEATPGHLVENDRDLAEWIASIGVYGEKNCGW